MSPKSLMYAACAASALAGMSPPLAAQSYPTKPIRVVAPYAPGGALDLTARTVGIQVQDALKQKIVVDNRTGAGGTLGADIVAKAAPDGYTVLLASPAEIAVLPHLQKLPYNVDKDFAPVSLAVQTPLILVVHPALPVKNVKELIALIKARPGQMTYASAGTGGVQHLAGELLKINYKLSMTHIPYKGAGAVMPELIGGHVPMFFSGMPPAVPHVRAGKLKALAVTSTKRSAAVPDVPTMGEAGVPNFVFTNWFAYFVPTGTPAAAVSRLNSEINRALRLDVVKRRLANVGAETVGTTPEELTKFVREESDKFAQLIKASGAKGTD